VGHDLVIEVGVWSATLSLDDDPAASTLELTAHPTSLRVRKGTGGVQPLAEADKTAIERTIDTHVLQRKTIAFCSTAIAVTDAGSP